MSGTTRDRRLPAMLTLLVVISGTLIAGGARADSGLVDVRTLPRLDGAQNDTKDDGGSSESYRLSYTVPNPVPNAGAAARVLFAADGWVPFRRPLEDSETTLLLKKGPLGLGVSVGPVPGKPGQARVELNAERINVDLPFPEGAAEVVFDGNRPYLNCIAAASVDATRAFFQQRLTAAGWSSLSGTDIAARWPNAGTDAAGGNAVRAYFGRDNQSPIVLTLQRRDDGRTGVDIRVAPFALPQQLAAGREAAGLPIPEHSPDSQILGGADSDRREIRAAVAAAVPAVLAFYRRELATRGWTEQAKGAVVTPDSARLAFVSADGNAVLELGQKYDFTIVNLVAQASEAAIAARAKAKQEAGDRFMKEAEESARVAIAESDARRAAANAAAPVETLHALAGAPAPVPVPDAASDIAFNGADGRLEFNSSSSVKSLAAFYRAAMQPLGWKEEPSVINKPTMAVLEFSRGRQQISFTVMQLGAKINVRADGSGLRTADAVAAAPGEPAKAARDLEAGDDSGLPVPKEHTMSSVNTSKGPGRDVAARTELAASVPADLDAVLAFYRRELAARQWKELPDGTVSKPDSATLAFTAPEGPALLKLGRRDGETTVSLAVKNPVEAARAGMAPARGQAKVLLGNMGEIDATLTINNKTIKVAAGAGGPTRPDGPTLELPPGKYSYAVKVAGHPAHNDNVVLGADDTWGLMIGPGGDGVLALQVY